MSKREAIRASGQQVLESIARESIALRKAGHTSLADDLAREHLRIARLLAERLEAAQ